MQYFKRLLGNPFCFNYVYINRTHNFNKMTNQNKTARLAGLLYLILVITGIINLMYIPSKFIVWDDAAKTIENITNSEFLFRMGIVSGIVAFLTFILLPMVLYKLLEKVNKSYAQLMVVFALVSIPISFTNILHKFSVLTLMESPKYLQNVDAIDLQNQVMLQLDYYSNGVELSQVFWGIWLLPFGLLVYKSGFLPKFLGVFLMLGCFGYLISFIGGFLFPTYHQTILSTIVDIPSSIGEIGICLWLLIMGTNKIKFSKTFVEK